MKPTSTWMMLAAGATLCFSGAIAGAHELPPSPDGPDGPDGTREAATLTISSASLPVPASTNVPDVGEAVKALEWDGWKGVSFGAYLAPKGSAFVDADGGVDVIFHFHAGQMSTKQMREGTLPAVFVSCGFGTGSGPYASALADAGRFARMLDEVTAALEKSTGRKGIHVRHLGLASWSAGFAAVGKILGVPRYYDQVDTVVLLDSLHAPYKGIVPSDHPDGKCGNPPCPSVAERGADAVDVRAIGSIVRFARDAAEGKKAMVITHSSIIPPDYGSTSETTRALLDAIDVVPQDGGGSEEAFERGMQLLLRADAGNLHVRGFRGRGPRDHFDHLYLIGQVLRSWVVPRWNGDDRLVYTLAREEP